MEVAEVLVKLGSLHVNAPDFDGLAPAHHAILSGNILVLQYLLENGGEIEAETIKKQTLLEYAIEQKLPEIVGFLLEKGADMRRATVSTWQNLYPPPLDKGESYSILITETKGTKHSVEVEDIDNLYAHSYDTSGSNRYY